jgi:hypothetical protein
MSDTFALSAEGLPSPPAQRAVASADGAHLIGLVLFAAARLGILIFVYLKGMTS